MNLAHYLAQKDVAVAQELAGLTGLQRSLIDLGRPCMPAVYRGALDRLLSADAHERGP